MSELFSKEYLEKLAGKVRNGFAVGKLTNTEMGIDHALNQVIRRKMKQLEKGKKPTIPFFICRLCNDYLEKYLSSLFWLNHVKSVIQSESQYSQSFKDQFFNTKKLSPLTGVVTNIKDEKDLDDKIQALKKEIEAIPESIFFCASIDRMQKLSKEEKAECSSLFEVNNIVSTWGDVVNSKRINEVK